MIARQDKFPDNGGRLARSYWLVGTLLFVVGGVSDLAVIVAVVNEGVDWSGVQSILAVTSVLVFGIAHWVAATLLQRRSIVGIYVGMSLSSLWIALGAAIAVIGMTSVIGPVGAVGIAMIVMPALKIRALWRAKPYWLDDADWAREGLPQAKGFEPIFPTQPTVSDREK